MDSIKQIFFDFSKQCLACIDAQLVLLNRLGQKASIVANVFQEPSGEVQLVSCLIIDVIKI